MSTYLKSENHQTRYSITLIDEAVECICNKGCRQVRLDILHIENNHYELFPKEIRDLNVLEQKKVLKELQDIMAAYNDTCQL